MTDTTMTAPVPMHLVAVTSDGYEFLAECSGCGWASEWHATAEDADAAGWNTGTRRWARPSRSTRR
jgi:hypothetical protein